MKRHISYIIIAAASLCANSVYAETVVDFETNDSFKSISVYDCWGNSPFRTGILNGNAAVTDNPDTSEESLNKSSKVLGAQRSRFGSNLFGVRVDLTEPFALATDYQYVHVQLLRPCTGRVALVALGKRDDRDDQTGSEEQIWVTANNEVFTDKWHDVVFPIKGNENVKIHSLVIVPECESPHTRTEDFLFYIDDILVDNSMAPRGIVEYYETNNDKNTTRLSQADRNLSAIVLNSPSFGRQSISINQAAEKMLYYKVTDPVLHASAGETLQASVDWNGTWMHAYLYIDLDDNGHFEANLADDGHSLTSSSELVTYSCLIVDNVGYSPTGRISNNNTQTMPSFTLPSNLKPGVYRARYKIDWNCADPAGNISSGNTIVENRGCITDVMLVITDGNPVNITANQLNGDVTDINGNVLDNTKIPVGQPYTIMMAPAPGFTYSGIKVKHGYNLDGDSIRHDNPQYHAAVFESIEFDANDRMTLPASLIDGNVEIEGLFVESGIPSSRIRLTYSLEYDGTQLCTQSVNATIGEAFPEVTWNTETSDRYFSIDYPDRNVDAEDGDAPIILNLHHSAPFLVSHSLDNAHWYNLTIGANQYVIAYNSATPSYIRLASTTTPEASNHTAQWCFIGNAFDGFKIYNRAYGSTGILSSSTNTATNTGGATYPHLTSEPVPATANTYWIPTYSNQLSGYDGFFLHQKGIPANRINYREPYLAYWTGGADGGSTVLCTLVESLGSINGIANDTDMTNIKYYNLQGIEMPYHDNLTPGIYIRRSNNHVEKIMIK